MALSKINTGWGGGGWNTKQAKKGKMEKEKISKFSQQERETIKELYEIARIKKYKLML